MEQQGYKPVTLQGIQVSVSWEKESQYLIYKESIIIEFWFLLFFSKKYEKLWNIIVGYTNPWFIVTSNVWGHCADL